ncbi:MlaD family protein [Schwartzia sp. (in: firmicutes)]
MNQEAKVGAFTVTGVVLLAAFLIGLSNFHLFGSRNYSLNVGFTEVIGLNPSAEVRFAGVPVGRVNSVETDGIGAVVKIEIKPDIKVPRGSKFSVGSSGFLSEKYILISPVEDRGDYLKDGEYVYGITEVTMDSMMANMNMVVNKVHDLMDSVNKVLGNPNLQSSMVETAINVRDITANMRDITASFARISANNENEINQLVRNLNAMSANLVETSAQVEVLVRNFSGDGETGANLRMAIANLASTSARIEHMAQSVEEFVTDPQTAEDLRTTLHNVRGVSEKANNMLGGLSGSHFEAGVEEMYNGRFRDWQTNFDMRFYPAEDRFLMLGLNDIGDGNRFNAQVGKKSGALGFRGGIIDSKVGIGLDVDAGSRWRFSVDGYDPNHAKVKARVRFKVTDDWSVFSQMNHVNDSKRRATYFGIRHDF